MTQSQVNWGYNDQYGTGVCTPDRWDHEFKVGKHQSPINIIVGPCQADTCCAHRTSSSSSNNNKLGPDATIGKLRRSHLDSVGEEERANGFSSAASNSSDSPERRSRLSDDSMDLHLTRRDQHTLRRPDSDNDHRHHNFHHHNHHHLHHVSRKDSDDSSERHEELMKLRWSHHHHGTNYKQHHHHHHHHHHQSSNEHQVQKTRFRTSTRKIFTGYPRYLNTIELRNTGHNWQVDFAPELAHHTLLSGPSLGERQYRLAQFHCHWGKDSNCGSEHQINGKSYAAEIHFVHWNCTDFSSLEEASKHKHGLAVLGVLVEAFEGEQHFNRHLNKIVAGLEKVRKPNSSATIEVKLDLKRLLPDKRCSYVSYDGSLTTPPLAEVVDWIVFLNPIRCSTSQIDQFREIRTDNHNDAPSTDQQSRLVHNCRPIQPLNSRTVTIWSHPDKPINDQRGD